MEISEIERLKARVRALERELVVMRWVAAVRGDFILAMLGRKP